MDRLLFVLPASFAWLFSLPAFAEGAELKTDAQLKAGALFAEARQLAESGDYVRACPKFEQSLRLNLGIGVQFNLANCWEHLGRNASAQALFQGVAASARAVGQVERAEVAQARADALEPRLVRMLIDVKASDPSLVVRRNHIVIEPKAWGAATPIDAGEYLIEATAANKKPWSVRLIVPATTGEVISVAVPQLDSAAEIPTSDGLAKQKPPALMAMPVEPKPGPLVQHSSAGSGRRAGYAYTLAGLGVVSLGLGTLLAVQFKSKNDDAKSICPSAVNCSLADVNRHAELISDAKTFRTWSFVGFGVGGAALVAATVLFVVPVSSSASGFSVSPFLTANGSLGASASGRF